MCSTFDGRRKDYSSKSRVPRLKPAKAKPQAAKASFAKAALCNNQLNATAVKTPETEESKNQPRNLCQQFTTICKILNSISKRYSGTGKKISVIGIDDIGAATVFSLLNQKITDNICMIDLDEDLLTSELLDLKMGALYHNNANIVASKDPAATEGSKICIIFTGTYRGNQEDPSIYVGRSIGIVRSIIEPVIKYSPDVIFILASDPVDILSYATWKLSGLPKNRIIGTGTLLDTARFRCALSQRMGISPLDCHGYIIGEPGKKGVPVWSSVNIAGVPLKGINPNVGTGADGEHWSDLFHETVKTEHKVRSLKGYNSWAGALAITNLCQAIVNNLRTVMPVSTYIKGEHTIMEDVFLSLPCVIGDSGVTDIIRQTLSDNELIQLRESARHIADLQNSARILEQFTTVVSS